MADSAVADADAADGGELEPSLRALLDSPTLNWIFVGGKGGVGKTTTSCSIAVQLAKVRSSVLIVSTDPAHNLSDAFGQQFGKEPLAVNGFDNLFAMEVDSNVDVDALMGPAGGGAGGPMDEVMGGMQGMFKDLMTSVPGIDEAMSFAELMKQVQQMNYSAIVFDTAPTGHTLRLLSFPRTMESAIGKLLGLRNRFSGLFQSMSGLFGGAGMPSEDMLLGKMQQMKALIDQVHTQIRDASRTTFVCVCIAEFLSIYETERLVQELTREGIDTRNVVVNQVLFPDQDAVDMREWFDTNRETLPAEAQGIISKTLARKTMQDKYIGQIFELYEEFHVVLVPLLDHEVRGAQAIEDFSAMLREPVA